MTGEGFGMTDKAKAFMRYPLDSGIQTMLNRALRAVARRDVAMSAPDAGAQDSRPPRACIRFSLSCALAQT